GEREVDELRDTGIASAARSLVLRDDDVREQRHGRIFMRREELRLVRAVRRGGGWFAGGRCGSGPRVRPRLLRALSDGLQGQRDRGRRSEDLQHLTPFHVPHGYTFPFRRSSAMYSAVRMANARIVQVRFLSACETNGPASATNTFFTSWACEYLLSTEVFGS